MDVTKRESTHPQDIFHCKQFIVPKIYSLRMECNHEQLALTLMNRERDRRDLASLFPIA